MILQTLERRLSEAGMLRLGILLGIAVVLAKLPLLFTTLGEQDHGRLIMDGVAYATNGTETFRQYGIFTSPLYTLPLAAIVKLFGTSHLVLLTNIGGWLCGGLASALVFVLLRQLGAGTSWAAAGAVASGLVPGTFYLSLYGYPSQYALPLLVASAVAFARALETKRAVWLVLAAVFYCGVALMKIDFVLTGSLLVAVAIILKKPFDRYIGWLPLFVVAALGIAFAAGSLAIKDENLFLFLRRVSTIHPWSAEELVESHASTVFYTFGWGTLVLFAGTLAAGVIRRDRRAHCARIAIAWAIAALPLLLFWWARPPMSSRHAVPGAFVTAFLAALLAAAVVPRLFPRLRARYAAPLWLAAVVALNWPFGEPNLDFNYKPSGNLAATFEVNRRAFAVVDDVARAIADDKKTIKAVIGHPDRESFAAIDFVPAILVEMASRSKAVTVVRMRWAGALVFAGKDGSSTRVFIYIHPERAVNLVRMRRVGYYSMYPADLTPLTKHGAEITMFDPEAMFEAKRKSP